MKRIQKNFLVCLKDLAIQELKKKMKLDKEYCDNWSLKLDLIILWRSIKTVLKQEGFHEGKYHRR